MKRRTVLAACSGLAGVGAVGRLPAVAAGGTDAGDGPSGDVHGGLDGYEASVTVATDDGGAPVDLTATVDGDRLDAKERVAVDVSLTNESDDAVTVSTGPPTPFGTFWLSGEDGGGLYAWNDDYGVDERERVERCLEELVWPDVVRNAELEPGETLRGSYRLSALTHGVSPGRYEGSLAFDIGKPDHDESWSAGVDATAALEPSAEPTGPPHERSLSADPIGAESFDGRIDVAVLRAPSERSPGLIEVAFVSEWDERRSVEAERGFPFGAYESDAAGGARLTLLPAGLYAPGFVDPDGCWLPTVVPCVDGPQYGEVRRSFDPGESVDQRFVVLAHPDDGCPPAGAYDFTARYESPGDGTFERDQAADLGFTLELGEASQAYREEMTSREAASEGTPEPTQTATPRSETETPERAETDTETEDTKPTRERAGASTTGANGTETPADGAGPGLAAGAAAALGGWLAARRGAGGEY